MPTQLIYIHGFNSSPLSHKAQLLHHFFQQQGLSNQLTVPTLSPSPKAAMAQLDSLIQQYPKVALIGSSLGGFYATWLAEQHNIRAALVNPAVQPWKLLDKYTGIQHNYHTGEAWQLEPAWVEELKRFDITQPGKPQHLLLLTQTGDTTLDWQQSWQRYQHCHLYRGLGGSHGFDDFAVFIPLILRFLEVA